MYIFANHIFTKFNIDKEEYVDFDKLIKQSVKKTKFFLKKSMKELL